MKKQRGTKGIATHTKIALLNGRVFEHVLDQVCNCPTWFYLVSKTKQKDRKTCNITGSDCMTSLHYCNDSLKISNSMLQTLQSIRSAGQPLCSPYKTPVCPSSFRQTWHSTARTPTLPLPRIEMRVARSEHSYMCSTMRASVTTAGFTLFAATLFSTWEVSWTSKWWTLNRRVG